MKDLGKSDRTPPSFAPHFGCFYIAKAGVVEKVETGPNIGNATSGKRLSAKEAAQRIVQQYGRSLAVLAD